MKATIKKFLQAVLVLALAAVFIFLGLWQLDRAQELQMSKEKVLVDQRIYPLDLLTNPTGIVPPTSIGKSVSATGYYIATYRAPNQVDGEGRVADWEVALLENTPTTAILVVRGLWSERLTSPALAMSQRVEISGILMPHQNDDRAANTDTQLSRLDSALLTSRVETQLYDGFIIAQVEKLQDGALDRSRVVQPVLSNGVPGFYWQHISYVVVWWFMAVMVLWLPFYRGPNPSLHKTPGRVGP